MGRRRRIAAAAVCALLCALGTWPALAQGYSKQTFSVAVGQPDELGNAVSLDTDVYLPDGAPPAGGWPLVEVFHGGGSDKANGFDAGHAAFFADHGYASLIYSQRGHGDSGGQTTVAGPKEMHDLFDVTGWALDRFPLDPGRIALTGYSQGGLNTNLAQVNAGDPSVNPRGIRLAALEPGNTPDITFEALVPEQVVKLSFGVGLVETYLVGTHSRQAPIVDKWIATAAADQPGLYGGDVCDASGHDTSTSTMKQDLAARSVGCFAERMTPPNLWAQAFDDGLFPPDMAISMWRRMPAPDKRLYLSMGGHAAPAAPAAVEQDKLDQQLAFLDHVLRGAPLSGPPIVYWTRDPAVSVPRDAYRYPNGAWYRQTSASWPPPKTADVTYQLGADGRAVRDGAAAGSLPLQPLSEDEANDPVAAAAMSSTPLGTSPVPRALPATNAPGFVAAFATDPLTADRELAGAPASRLAWTPASPDTQLVLEVFDRAPDGTLSLLSRGVTGIRAAAPGQARSVDVRGQSFSALVRAGHSLVAWVMAGDLAFYKPYPGSIGGALQAGSDSTLTIPLRPAKARKARP